MTRIIPIAGQIIGSEPVPMARAAQLLHEAGYDVIDLNFACPVKKIKNKARGGHMLFDTERAVSIVKGVRDALPPPTARTTVSLRRGVHRRFKRIDRAIRNKSSKQSGRTITRQFEFMPARSSKNTSAKAGGIS